MPDKMVYTDKPPSAASSAGNAKRLVTTGYSKLILKVMGPFAINSVQPNTLSVDEHGSHNTVSIDLATVVPGNKPSNNASQRFPVEEDLQQTFM